MFYGAGPVRVGACRPAVRLTGEGGHRGGMANSAPGSPDGVFPSVFAQVADSIALNGQRSSGSQREHDFRSKQPSCNDAEARLEVRDAVIEALGGGATQ